MGVGAAVGTAIGWAVGANTGIALGTSISVGFSLGRSYDNYQEAKELQSQLASSSAYSFGPIRNTKSQELPIPVAYGRNRVAGNIIFQKISGDNNQYMNIQVGVSEGPIKSITEVKADDVSISPGIRIGNRAQTAHTLNPQDQTFPYLAYISVSLDAEELELSGTPTITSIIEGRKVEIWDDVAGSWITQYSQNPAYCLFDFLTNSRYGLGIDKQYVDLDSFIEVANHCDETVDDGNGNQVPRFQLDYVIDSKQSSLDIIQSILGTFRAFLLYSGGELRLKADMPEAPVQSYTMDNIVEDSFSYNKSSRKEVPNKVLVQYTDPNKNWQKVYAQYTDDRDIEKRGKVVDKTISLLGINRFNQAGRLARFYQKKAKFCSTFCEFKVGIDSLHCEVGDVITLTHDVPGWVDKEFRILEIHEEENDEMRLVCQEYNEAIYSDAGVVEQPKKDSTLPNPFAKPASVQNLSLVEQNEVLGDGTWVPGVKVSWTQPDYIVWEAGNIYISSDNGATWDFIARVEGEEYPIDTLAPGTYKIKVVSESNKGRKEDFDVAATGQITVHGKDMPPSDVTWSICSFGKIVKLQWNDIPDNDIEVFEVRTDTNFGSDDEALIFKGKGLSHEIPDPSQRLYTFYVKALDESENYSKNANSITVSNDPPAVPPQPIVTEFFQGLWIEVQGVNETDIDGYYVYLTPSDGEGNPTGSSAEVIDIATPQKIVYEANPGSSFLIEVAAYDIFEKLDNGIDGEGSKSASIEATTAHVNSPDIPDGLLEQNKLTSNLSSKIDTAKANSDDYINQIIAYPTEEDNSISTTDYIMTYSAGDIYTGAEIETDPNSFFDITDQSDNEITDSNGDQITITDVQDELGNSILGVGNPTWYGAGSGEEVHLILSAIPDPNSARFHYGVKKKLSELSGDALLKKGVTSKQADANLIASIENMRGFAWNEPVPSDMTMQQVESRVTTNEGEVSSNKTSINQNADEISTNATNIQFNNDGISANQSNITQNATDISTNVTSIQINADDISVHQSNITQNSDSIQSNVTAINTVDDKVNDRSIAIPDGAELFHFDETLQSTKQLEPIGTPVATLRKNEGKFGGAVAVEEGTTNLTVNPKGDDGNSTGWRATFKLLWEVVTYKDKQCFHMKHELQYRMVSDRMSVTEGLDYTASIEFIGTVHTINIGWYDSSGNQLSSSVIHDKYSDGQSEWTRILKTFTAPNGAVECEWYIDVYSRECWITEFQIEQKPFATSFVNNSRNNGILQYKPSELGLNLNNGAWTILIWTKYNEYQMTQGVRAPLLELGEYFTSNETSITFGPRRGYNRLVGVLYDNQNLNSLSVINFTAEEAIDWILVALRYDGIDQLDLITVSKDSGIQVRNNTVAWANPIRDNIYVGCDSWDHTHNGLIDELMPIPKTISNEQIQEWYNSNAPFYDPRQTEIQQSQVTQLADEYTVKVQEHANGQEVVSGFGLSLEDGVSEFGIIADRFKIYGDPSNPNETATPVFALDTENNQMYLLGDLIADGTITARMLSTSELITDSAQIRDAIITDAKIKDASITDAKIKDATITNAKINGGSITADKFNSTLYGDLSQAMMLTKKIMSAGDEYEYFLDQNDLDNATKTNIDATHHGDYGLSIRLATQKLWDEGTWDSGTWDIPVESSGTFESISNDIGLLSTFQISFECILQKDPATDITVEAIYSTDNTNWGTNRGTLNDNMWETLLMQEIGNNILRFVGSLFSLRYFKIRITLSTSDTSQRIILYNCKYYGNVVNMYGFFENEQIASGGKSFSTQGFNDPPAVNVTPKGTSPLVPVVNNVSSDGFTVQLFDLSGSDVGGNADIIYMGV